MSGRKKMKTNIHMSKPELPPFLQKMREQIVANEDADRRERGEWDRKNRGAGRTNQNNLHDEDDPTIVKLDENDITEEEYKRMKLELETKYKLNEPPKGKQSEELDIDNLIEMRRAEGLRLADDTADTSVNKSVPARREPGGHRNLARGQAVRRVVSSSSKRSDERPAANSKSNKKLSYDSSDDDDE